MAAGGGSAAQTPARKTLPDGVNEDGDDLLMGWSESRRDGESNKVSKELQNWEDFFPPK